MSQNSGHSDADDSSGLPEPFDPKRSNGPDSKTVGPEGKKPTADEFEVVDEIPWKKDPATREPNPSVTANYTHLNVDQSTNKTHSVNLRPDRPKEDRVFKTLVGAAAVMVIAASVVLIGQAIQPRTTSNTPFLGSSTAPRSQMSDPNEPAQNNWNDRKQSENRSPGTESPSQGSSSEETLLPGNKPNPNADPANQIEKQPENLNPSVPLNTTGAVKPTNPTPEKTPGTTNSEDNSGSKLVAPPQPLPDDGGSIR